MMAAGSAGDVIVVVIAVIVAITTMHMITFYPSSSHFNSAQTKEFKSFLLGFDWTICPKDHAEFDLSKFNFSRNVKMTQRKKKRKSGKNQIRFVWLQIKSFSISIQ